MTNNKSIMNDFKVSDYIILENKSDHFGHKTKLKNLINKYNSMNYKEIIKSLIYDYIYSDNMILSKSIQSFKANEAYKALIDYINKLKHNITKEEFINILKSQHLFVNDLYSDNLNSYDFYILCENLNFINDEQQKQYIINRIARLYNIVEVKCDATYCKANCECGIQELEEDCTVLFEQQSLVGINRIYGEYDTYDYKIFNLEKHGDNTFKLYILLKELINIFN